MPSGLKIKDILSTFSFGILGNGPGEEMAGVTQVVSASPGTKPDPPPPREVLWLSPLGCLVNIRISSDYESNAEGAIAILLDLFLKYCFGNRCS